MYTLTQLQKQQIGLRLPKYLIEKIDEMTERYQLNRTDIIVESIKSYIENQEAQEFYNEFDVACQELQGLLSQPKKAQKLQSLEDLLDEL